MSARVRRGLVVGKFCPLHLGHEALIRHAQAQCDELLVLSYTQPGFPGYGRERRAAWLQARCPGVESHVLDDDELARRCAAQGLPPRRLPSDDAPGDEHRHFVAWLLQTFFGGPVDAVFTSEDYGDGFAAVLGAVFGRPVRHVCVDPARAAVPVSGTQVRRDPMACRDWLGPEVYADLVPRIALLGGESTGKTTLAAALAAALDTVWVPEFGRLHWEQRGGELTLDDMALIASTQVQWEAAHAQGARGWLVCDTTPLTTRLYSELLFGRVADTVAALARRPYALTLLCEPDFGFVQDGSRQDARFQAEQQRRYVRALDELGVAWHRVGGSVSQRVERVKALLQGSLATQG